MVLLQFNEPKLITNNDNNKFALRYAAKNKRTMFEGLNYDANNREIRTQIHTRIEDFLWPTKTTNTTWFEKRINFEKLLFEINEFE